MKIIIAMNENCARAQSIQIQNKQKKTANRMKTYC